MVRLPDLDSTSDLHRYTSSVRSNSLVESSNLQSGRHSPDSISWHGQSGPAMEQHSLSRPLLPSLNLPSITMTTSPSLSAHCFGGRSPGPSSVEPKSAFFNSVNYAPARPVSYGYDAINSRSPLYGAIVTNSPTSMHNNSMASLHTRNMGVQGGRIKKSSNRCRSPHLQRQISISRREIVEGRGPSPHSISGSLDSESSIAEGRLDNRKAGKERNAREDIRTQMEKHYKELMAAGAGYAPITRLNKHNSDVARIPCKKEEVLDLSYKLHEERRGEISLLRNAMHSILAQIDKSPAFQGMSEVQAIAEAALNGKRPSDYYSTNTPEATPSPEHTMNFLQLPADLV